MRDRILSAPERSFIAASRRAVLATLNPDGEPRLVPVCFVLTDTADRLGRPVLYTPIDEKPKKVDDPRDLARVRDLLVLPTVTLIVDRWSEDWSHLGWVRLHGRGELLEPEPREATEHATAVRLLRAKYPQYETHALDERPVIRMTVDRVRSWGDLEPDRDAPDPSEPGAPR
jgi:PPOX class probable F420-dependent enzyme